MYIIFLGPPGAGKGTYSQILSQVLNIPILATGDMLRAEIERKTELGREVETYVQAGELVPDDVMSKVVQSALSCEHTKNGVIFDGFPRTIAQAHILDEIISKNGEKIDIVIELQSTDDVIIERLSNRRVCPKCGRIYHLINSPPKNDEICDNDGEKLIQREDDRPSTIKNRLKIYHEQTAPILSYFKAKNDILYLQIETAGPPEIGRNKMMELLRKHSIIT